MDVHKNENARLPPIHESVGDLILADSYLERGDIITLERERIKREAMTRRRLLHYSAAA